jgi:hypothetical protein
MLALLPLILSIVPDLAKWIAGDTAGAVAGKAVNAATAILGTSNPQEAAVAMQDPVKAAELRLALAKVQADAEASQRQADLEAFKASLADVAGSRTLSGQSPLIARAQVAGAAAILCVWAFMVLRIAIYGLPYGSGEFYATILAAVSGILGGIMQFFYGNSTASHAANQRLDMLASQATNGQPAAIATTGQVTVNQGATTDDLNEASLRAARAG